MTGPGPGGSSEYRFGDLGSFFFKFADLSRPYTPGALAPGMYLPVTYLSRMIDEGILLSKASERPAITYDVPRYLTNTNFASLIKDAWIGTRGHDLRSALELVATNVEEGIHTTLAIASHSDSA